MAIKTDYSVQGNSFMVSRYNVPMAHFEMEYQAVRFIEIMGLEGNEWEIRTVFVQGIWDK